MATHSSGLKVPTRPAPGLPGNKSKVKNYGTNEVEQSVDPFSPVKSLMGLKNAKNDKRIPPPRPPPPAHTQQIHISRSIFGKKKVKAAATAIVKPMPQPPPTIPTGTLIDLQSPPSSPIFESKLKNSFSFNKSKNSQVESGFEDDFNSLVSSTATTPGIDPWSNSPSPTNFQNTQQLKPKNKPISVSKPTIICVPNDSKSKPSRPPPPKAQSENFTKEGSPPMPSCPPPPPPPEVFDVLSNGPSVPPRPKTHTTEEAHCIAMYDYTSSHPEDLSFITGDKIDLIERVSDEWLKGKLADKEGIFPESYVEIVVPLEESLNMKAIAIFPFKAETWDDLELNEGDEITVIRRINDDWLYGESDGKRGQFPECFVQDITDFDD